MCFPSGAEQLYSHGQRQVRCHETCSRQIAGRWWQHHASGPTSPSAWRLAHTHTQERAAVVHGHGMFRSGYTPSSWIPWMPPCQTWDISPSLWGDVSRVRCCRARSTSPTVPRTHPCTVWTESAGWFMCCTLKTSLLRWHWQWKQRCLG